MKNFLLFIFCFLLISCSKPKVVLICGDHICVNKSEAKQYFEENLTLEVKIEEKSNDDEMNLVELNLSNKSLNDKSIKIFSKKQTNKPLKRLSKKEIKELKDQVNKKKKEKVIKKLAEKKLIDKEYDSKKISRQKIKRQEVSKIMNNNVNKFLKKEIDVCTIIKNCSIDEISKYLLTKGKNKNFPDISKR